GRSGGPQGLRPGLRHRASLSQGTGGARRALPALPQRGGVVLLARRRDPPSFASRLDRTSSPFRTAPISSFDDDVIALETPGGSVSRGVSMSSIIAVSWPMVRRVLLTICVAFAFAACGDPDDDPGNTGGTGAVPGTGGTGGDGG